MKFKSLALLAVLSMSSVYGAGGESGGGGGGICTPKKCITLAQAGLRIDETRTAYFELDQEVIDEAKTIIGSIKIDFWDQELLSRVVGSKDTYAVVNENEVKKFSRFKKEYFEILDAQSVSKNGFELLAVSQGDKTYLLPGFDKLDIRGKALLLIHEALVRRLGLNTKGATKTIKDVLQFDGMLLDYLKGKEEGSSFDDWKMVDVLMNVRLIGDDNRSKTEAYVKSLINTQGPQPVESFCSVSEAVSEFHESGKPCYIDHERSLSLRVLHPLASQKLSASKFTYHRGYNVTDIKRHMALLISDFIPTAKEMIKVCDKNPGKDLLAVLKIDGKNKIVRLDCR